MESREIHTITIECPGYSTVRFNKANNEVRLEFGDGSVLVGNPDCQYDMYHQDSSHLQIQGDGTALYHPKPNPDLEVLDSSPTVLYTMTHCDPQLVRVVDNEGTSFLVTNTGECTVTRADGAEPEVSRPLSYKQHAPR